MNYSSTLFEIIVLFLVISFFSFNTTSLLSTKIKQILNNDIGFVISLFITICLIVKKQFIYLAIILFIIMKHRRIIEGAGEADEDEDEDSTTQAREEAGEEAEAIQDDLGVSNNMLNDGNKLETFWDLLVQSKKNADDILNSSSTM